MADSKLPLSPASPGGQIEDVENLVVPDPGLPPAPPPGLINLVRQRVQTVGRLYTQIAAVLDAAPAANEFGLVVRALVAQLPAALVGGRLDTNIGSWLGSTAPTVGQKTMADSVPVVIPSDQTLDVDVTNNVNNDSVGPFAVAPPSAGTQLGAEDSDGFFAPVVFGQAAMTDSLPVTIASDQSALKVEGRAASGAAATGNPVLSGGTDGADARSFLTDTSGRQQVVGAAADGAAVAGNPVLIAGQDGTNAQSLLTDTSGRPNVVGAAAQGAAVAGNPVLFGAEDAGGLTQRVRTAITLPGTTDPGVITRNIPTFYGTQANAWNATAVAANGTSTAIDTQLAPNISVFGNASGTTRIAIQLSQDNVNFYDVTDQNVPGGGDFGISGVWGARYVRLKSSQARTITATISAKG